MSYELPEQAIEYGLRTGMRTLLDAAELRHVKIGTFWLPDETDVAEVKEAAFPVLFIKATPFVPIGYQSAIGTIRVDFTLVFNPQDDKDASQMGKAYKCVRDALNDQQGSGDKPFTFENVSLRGFLVQDGTTEFTDRGAEINLPVEMKVTVEIT